MSVFSKKKETTEKIYLNVYDLHPVNNYFYFMGLGAYHSGVELYGSEYSFGGHEYAFTGVFELEPRTASGVIFRERLLVGETTKTRRQVQTIVDQISEEFSGNSYHPLQRNCNSFSQEFLYRLTGKSIPNYINRLAHIGNFFSCIIPSLNTLNTPNATNQNRIQDGSSDSNSNNEESKDSNSINSPLFPGQGYVLRNPLPPPPPLELSSSSSSCCSDNLSVSGDEKHELDLEEDDEDDDDDDENKALKKSTITTTISTSSKSPNSELEERRRKMLLAANSRAEKQNPNQDTNKLLS